METTQAKLKPFHIIVIVIMAVFAVVFFLNKDKLNPNAGYAKLYSTFLQAEGTIVSSENTGGMRGTMEYTIQFHDQNDSLITVVERNWQTLSLQKGDKVTMYYNPKDPREATPESRWREVMGK